MNKGVLGNTDHLRTKRFYHGTRAELKPGDLIKPGNALEVGERDRMATYAI
jgi:rifampin ADP-ribosylating transferase